jgi:hypothetical protein
MYSPLELKRKEHYFGMVCPGCYGTEHDGTGIIHLINCELPQICKCTARNINNIIIHYPLCDYNRQMPSAQAIILYLHNITFPDITYIKNIKSIYKKMLIKYIPNVLSDIVNQYIETIQLPTNVICKRCKIIINNEHKVYVFDDIYSCQSCLQYIINYSANSVLTYPINIFSIASSNVIRYVFGES